MLFLLQPLILCIATNGSIFSILPAQTRIPDGSESSPAINFTSDTDTGIFRPTTNTFSIATEGKECFRLDSDQRLLVGDLSDGTLNDQNAMLYVKTEGVQKGLAIRTAGSGTDVISVWSNKIDAGDGVDNDDVHLVAWRVGSGTALRGSIFYDESDGQVDYNRTSDRRLKENIVDIDFQVVWNVNDPARFLFNLREPQATIRAVSESAMREIIAQSDLAPILNRDRAAISDSLELLIQNTLDSYDSGVNVVRVNFDKADPPEQVIDSFREVQAAEQQRDRLEKEADAYANRILAQARGEAAQVREQAEAYRAQVVNEATGEASRFGAVLTEYKKAPDVTRKRLYLETMERVLGDVEKVIIDESAGGSGVVPYLPLNQLRQETK